VKATRDAQNEIHQEQKGRESERGTGHQDYAALLEQLEELDAIRAYDAAKFSGENPVPFERAIEEIERPRK
jgi:hypothetical protein